MEEEQGKMRNFNATKIVTTSTNTAPPQRNTGNGKIAIQPEDFNATLERIDTIGDKLDAVLETYNTAYERGRTGFLEELLDLIGELIGEYMQCIAAQIEAINTQIENTDGYIRKLTEIQKNAEEIGEYTSAFDFADKIAINGQKKIHLKQHLEELQKRAELAECYQSAVQKQKGI